MDPRRKLTLWTAAITALAVVLTGVSLLVAPRHALPPGALPGAALVPADAECWYEDGILLCEWTDPNTGERVGACVLDGPSPCGTEASTRSETQHGEANR